MLRKVLLILLRHGCAADMVPMMMSLLLGKAKSALEELYGTGDEAMHKMTRQNAVTGQYGQLSTSVPIKICQKFKKVFRDCSLCQPFAWSSTNEPSHQLRIADGHARGTCT